MGQIVSVQQALKYVSEHPEPENDDLLSAPVWELTARALFSIANNPDARVRGSVARATKAQRIIMNRLVGKRRTGTHPATVDRVDLDFTDLTGREMR